MVPNVLKKYKKFLEEELERNQSERALAQKDENDVILSRAQINQKENEFQEAQQHLEKVVEEDVASTRKAIAEETQLLLDEIAVLRSEAEALPLTPEKMGAGRRFVEEHEKRIRAMEDEFAQKWPHRKLYG